AGTATVPRIAVPGTATLDPPCPFWRILSVFKDALGLFGRHFVGILALAISAPFPDIAVNVVQAPPVCFFRADWVRLAPRIVVRPGVVPEHPAIVAEAEGVPGGAAGSARILPLRLGRKVVDLLCLFFAQPSAERHRIIPRHEHHRLVVRRAECVVLPGM